MGGAVPFKPPDLSVRAVGDDTWALLEDVRYRGRDQVFTVPAEFLTDFASVPRAVTWLVPTTGRYLRAAVLHDWLLCTIGITSGVISPRDADGVFRRVMRELGVPVVRRWLMWAGVRWGALVDRERRAGWWRDALPVLGISLEPASDRREEVAAVDVLDVQQPT
jgi:hypothetical protein